MGAHHRQGLRVSDPRCPGPYPYGVVPDHNDNIWIGLWNAGKLAKFDTTTHQWTEFTPPTYPGHVRRPNVDSRNNVWFGIYAAGPRPGRLVKLDQSTGRMTEHTIPQQDAAPYDVAMDADDNIWAADVGQGNDGDHGASIWRFDPRTETFTFYPKPQQGADSPKIQVTRDGAVWYSPRGSRDAPPSACCIPTWTASRRSAPIIGTGRLETYSKPDSSEHGERHLPGLDKKSQSHRKETVVMTHRTSTRRGRFVVITALASLLLAGLPATSAAQDLTPESAAAVKARSWPTSR